ncbi:MAG: hypothetical protein JWP11_1197 [Frankiales bacterium]|nr:hypothetical protein [Frankiales bacterium]
MGSGTAFLLMVLMGALFLYALYFVVRAGVAAGIKQALPDSALRPTEAPPYDGARPGPDGAQV